MGSLYSEYTTWLHGWRAGAKLLALALLGTLLFALRQPWMLAAAAVLCAALYASLGAATRAARRLMVSVLVGAALVAVFHAAMGHWALAATSALRLACAASLLPPFAVLLAGAVLLYCIDPAALQQRVTMVYALTASVALLAIVGLPRLTARGRVALVVFSILALSAIGSELWN